VLEHAYRKLIKGSPVLCDTSIPLQLPVQTAVMATLTVTARWASLLASVVVAGVVWRGLPAEAIALAAPALWADRSVVTYARISRR
jgi:hypothetical protein